METFSALLAILAICVGNSPVPGEFPAQRPVVRSFDAFFDLLLITRLSKQSWGWWFETPSRLYDVIVMVFCITSPVRTPVDGQVMRNYDVFFAVNLKEILSKQ